jgi:tRNA-specific 2-thiouridylase
MSDRVLAAVSGGVDSAVAACLLKQSGFEVIAVTMQLMRCSEDDEVRRGSCCSLRGIESARHICDCLDMQHSVTDMTAVFEQEITRYFLREYSRGRTPNPCIECNRLIKFAHLSLHAADLGCAGIATGHYARTEDDGAGRWLLRKGIDKNKDQSYFLWALTQDQLRLARFPVGGKTKQEVRRIADETGISGLVTAESQDICFLKDRESCQSFVRERLAGRLQPGPICDTAGNVLGRHEGIALYTIGQRRGLGIAGGRPLYVIDIIPTENLVMLGPREEAMTRCFRASGANWIAFADPPAQFEAAVKIRYAHPGAKAKVTTGQGVVEVELEEPQFAVAPGQSAVFYDGDLLLGGAVIDKRL